MDEEMMIKWIELVWEPATEGKRALLVLDSHITNGVKKKRFLVAAQAKYNPSMFV